MLEHLRQMIGEYNFAGQYQQAPTPLGGGLVKAAWFKHYAASALPQHFDRIVQSWDTANKATELSDFSVCTTWGIAGKDLYLVDLLRRRMEYPELKREVRAIRAVSALCRADRGQSVGHPAYPGADPRGPLRGHPLPAED